MNAAAPSPTQTSTVRPSGWMRWSVIAVATVSVLLPVLAALTAPADAALVTVGSVTSIFAVLGAFVLSRRPGHRIGWLYLVIGFETGAFQYVNSMVLEDEARLRAYEFVLAWFTGAGWAIGPLLIVTFGLLWLPDGALPSPRWRWVERLTWFSVIGVAAVFPLTESPQAVREVVPIDPATAELLFLGVVGVAAAAILACVASPFVRYRGASPRVRQQLRLVGIGGLLAIAIYLAGDVLVQVLPLTWEHVFALAVAVVPAATTAAVVRHGMLDVGRVLRRTATYALVTALLVGVYVSSVLGIGALLPTARNSDLLVALSTLAVAAMFRPARQRIQRAIDRRFNRARFDAAHLVGDFGTRVRDEVDVTDVTTDLRVVACVAVAPTTAAVWLLDADR